MTADRQKKARHNPAPYDPPAGSSPHSDHASQPLSASTPANRRLSSGSACETCRRRKTKCDGNQPCSFCAANNIECINRAEKKRAAPAHADVESLEKRVKQLEGLVAMLLQPVVVNALRECQPPSISEPLLATAVNL
ncbi:uncharacterized protein VTP21DRAFT_9294, partial [Calcarisporiella thermophila]|uniref:uncharacterized protein n=1 Tax=Calcarisporiella thermophila TaxID=911321 RepID=UPI0037445532